MNQENFSFVIYLIHACSESWNTTPAKVYKALKKSGCLKYLVQYYDILHTQSTQYLVHDVSNYLKNHGVSV